MSERIKYYLGIDCGASSLSFAVINEEEGIEEAFIESLIDGPIEAIKRGMGRLAFDFEDSFICAVGITGSGCELVAAIVGADTIVGEVSALASFAFATLPEVENVIQMGHRDSAFMQLNQGKLVDFAAGDICISGIGAFIEHAAALMGMTTEEFGYKALYPANQLEIKGQCTCFMEEEIIRKRQMGYGKNDLASGICAALADKYIEKVIADRQVSGTALFVGGVAENAGLKKALSAKLKMKVIVPEYFREAEAIGAAILAKRQEHGRSRFRGFAIAHMEIGIEVKSCADCNNACEIVSLMIEERESGILGDYCTKHKARL